MSRPIALLVAAIIGVILTIPLAAGRSGTLAFARPRAAPTVCSSPLPMDHPLARFAPLRGEDSGLHASGIDPER
ncbi:MAG: hypothetical protein HY056_01270 [Proteobacteria bacterium]|nr:hypothetical protein [Pseudomonadota bacterium]